jgi:hypothetical protein
MSYVAIIALRYPKAAPALPVEARTLGSGVGSLFITIAVSIAAGYALVQYLSEHIVNQGIWAATAAIAIG